MTIVKKVEQYIFDLFKNELPATYVYHTFLHTQRVVESAKELLEHIEVATEDKNSILIAAWFHDAGYIHGKEAHEEASITILEKFASEHPIEVAQLETIKSCIRATTMGVKPKNLLEEIMKDADSSHLAKPYFNQVSELLRQELSIRGEHEYSRKQWNTENINLLTTQHKFYTRYAIENWQAEKNKNLVGLLKKKKKKATKLKKEKTKAKLKAKYKEESPERGIQTLFRVTLRNHIKLSDIADTKANILLSVNAIIISLALANLIPKLDSPTNRHLMIPSLVLVLFSVASIILSILSTQPKVTGGEFTKDEVRNGKVNVLFFGNFYKMKYDQYQWAMDEIIKNKSQIYTMLTKDLYFLGLVLEKKYRLLKITYIVFTIGILLSVLAFIIAFIMI